MNTARFVGIDVGAPSNGYHAVGLSGTRIGWKYHSCDPSEVARWCIDQAAEAVSIDAPCHWRSTDGPARAAELALAKDRISCFSTPTEEKARGHAFYTWMFAGHALYAALAEHYPIYTGSRRRSRVAIETFPQAVACALAGDHVSAKQKFANRSELLRRAGFDTSPLRNIDAVDATLCALAAQHFVANTFKAYGDPAGGFIIVPRDPLAGKVTAPAKPSRSHAEGAEPTAAFTKILALLPMLTPAERLQLSSHVEDTQR